MTAGTRFIDTTILLYSVSQHPLEARKRDVAVTLLDSDDLALSVQVLQEFYVQATRATRQDALPHEIAAGLIRTWLRFHVQDVTQPVMLRALDIRSRHGLSYWDAAIVSAAQASGSSLLLTEDLAHGVTIDGLEIANPFRE